MDKYSSLKLENQLCFSLYATSREVIKLYKPLLDKYDITYTQYLVMLVLWEKQSVSVKEIGNKLHLDSGTLTPVIKKLDNMGLLMKYRDKEDDRIVIVELTQSGLELKDRILEVPEAILFKVGSNIEELRLLKINLDKLLKTLSNNP